MFWTPNFSMSFYIWWWHWGDLSEPKYHCPWSHRFLVTWGESQKLRCWEFPGGPVVRTRRFHHGGPGSIPGRGTKILQARQVSREKNNLGTCQGHSACMCRERSRKASPSEWHKFRPKDTWELVRRMGLGRVGRVFRKEGTALWRPDSESHQVSFKERKVLQAWILECEEGGQGMWTGKRVDTWRVFWVWTLF